MTKQVIFVLLLAIALSIAAVVLKGRGRRGARGDIRPRKLLTEREKQKKTKQTYTADTKGNP